jgi:Tol biopolymer transport system component
VKRGAIVALALPCVGIGCYRRNIVECADQTDCEYVNGTCTVNPTTGHQWCTYADPTCPSGSRWAEVLTGDDLDGMCVGGGGDQDADLDPDAEPCVPRIAWEHEGATPTAVWIGALDGTDQRIVTSGVADPVGSPRWSPQGNRIAYVAQSAIWVVDTLGGAPAPVSVPGPGMDSGPEWTPDGTGIVFRHYEGGTNVITRVDAAGGSATPLSDAENVAPQFSVGPSGAIAFESHRDGNAEIYVMDANGFNETNITNDPQTDKNPVWSPDGTKIAFRSNRDGTEDIWTMDADGGNPTNLNALDGSETVNKFSWFPDATKIVFDKVAGLSASVWVMNADGTGSHAIVSVPSYIDAYPTISSDNSRVAWVRVMDISAPDSEIWIATVDGADPVRITNSPETDRAPVWPACP